MKRALLLLLTLLFLTGTATATTIDLSGMSYAELVALKDQINLAMWNSQEWQEVTVPQGVWLVGEDIPAGHWTVKCAPGCKYTSVEWGEYLSDSGEYIRWKGRYSASNFVYNPESTYYRAGEDLAEYSFIVKEGEYIVIDRAPAIFSPYVGKPNLGFK